MSTSNSQGTSDVLFAASGLRAIDHTLVSLVLPKLRVSSSLFPSHVLIVRFPLCRVFFRSEGLAHVGWLGFYSFVTLSLVSIVGFAVPPILFSTKL